MHETKVKPVRDTISVSHNAVKHPKHIPFIPRIARRFQIMYPLSIRHTAPDLLPRCVAPFVVQLGRDNQNDIVGHQAQEHVVASAVERFVLVTVDLKICQTLVRNDEMLFPRTLARSLELRGMAVELPLTFEPMTLDNWTHML